MVVAGDGASQAARLAAEAGRWPLFAEPSSRARTGPAVVSAYRLLLQASPLAGEIERVLVFGHPTLSRPIAKLLARPDVELIVVAPTGLWPDPARRAASVVSGLTVTGPDTTGWLQRWQDADQAARPEIDKVLADRLSGPRVAALVGAAVGADGMLVVASSNPVRDLDLAPVVPIRTIANRGLAGIDGTVSSAIGAALGRPHSTRAIAYVGDVTFLHDATALFIGAHEGRPDLTIVVANDNGGSIFATLEQGAPEHAASYDLLFGTPHGVDLASLCAATRTPHWRVTERSELEHALASPNGGLEVIEALVRRDNRRSLDEQIRALAR